MTTKHLHHKKLFDQAARSKAFSSFGRNIDDKGSEETRREYQPHFNCLPHSHLRLNRLQDRTVAWIQAEGQSVLASFTFHQKSYLQYYFIDPPIEFKVTEKRKSLTGHIAGNLTVEIRKTFK